MTDTAAREEAERRYPSNFPVLTIEAEAFIAGTEWRDAQVAKLIDKATRWVHAREAFEASNAAFSEAWDEDQAYLQVEDELAACVRALSDPGEEDQERR